MRKRGNPTTHRKAKLKSRERGNLEIRREAALKDAEFEETRRPIAGRAGRCRIQGDLKNALRGEAGQLKIRGNPGILQPAALKDADFEETRRTHRRHSLETREAGKLAARSERLNGTMYGPMTCESHREAEEKSSPNRAK